MTVVFGFTCKDDGDVVTGEATLSGERWDDDATLDELVEVMSAVGYASSDCAVQFIHRTDI